MPNQDRSRAGMPRKDQDRPSPDVGAARATGHAERQDDGGEGPGKMGLASDRQPDLVAPSGVNERDHGAADDRPAAGGELQFDDGTDEAHPRGKVTGADRTWNEKNPSDAGKLGAPKGPGMSDRVGPSDPDAKRGR